MQFSQLHQLATTYNQLFNSKKNIRAKGNNLFKLSFFTIFRLWGFTQKVHSILKYFCGYTNYLNIF